MKILIVEDNARTRKLLVRILRNGISDDFDVRECESGESSLVQYPAYRPDWTLMDINLTGMSGLDATRFIVQYDAKAKILIVTGLKEPGWREAALEAGASNFVEKDNLSMIPKIISDFNRNELS